MIERGSISGYEVYCDDCSHSEFFDTDHWDQLMIEMKAYGFQTRKEDGEWVHRCRDCKNR